MLSPVGALRRVGGAARQGDALKRQALDAASRQLRPLCGERARIDAHPGNLRGKAAVFDLGTAVHHDLKTVRLGKFRRLVIAYAKLHPNDAWARLHLQRLDDDRKHMLGGTEYVDHVDRLRYVNEGG